MIEMKNDKDRKMDVGGNRTMKRRNEVEESLKWDLTRLFKTEEEYEKALEDCIAKSIAIENNYKGKINNAEIAAKAITDYNDLLEKQDLVSHYAELSLSVDVKSSINQKREIRFSNISSEIAARVKFLEESILHLSTVELNKLLQMIPEYSVYIEDIGRKKEYVLTPQVEEVLETMAPTLESNYKGYEITKMADMHFDSFKVNAKEYPNSYVLYENVYQFEPNTEIRRKAFDSFSKTLKKYENTTAHFYQSHIQKEKILSDMRGFESIFDYLLFDQKVTKEMYHRQIDLIMNELSPHMQKYAALLKKIYQLDKITFADLKIPLEREIAPKIDIEGSKEYVKGSLSILGQDYLDMVMKSYEERWVDFAQNEGKSTGGFCASPYQRKAYILLSWTELLSEVFTLVHELGHAGHFILAQQDNRYLNQEPSLYFIEAPSTMNELLLTKYLLKQYSEDKKMKRWVLSNMIANTYFHNFVTHLLEAAYQREVYRMIDEGNSVQAEDLNTIKRTVLHQFWGNDVEINQGAELTWMRQPHYYMGLYSYTYSAGLTIGTQMCNRLTHEGEIAAKEWIEVLKAGGTKTPIELAAMVGIDITTDKPLRDTIAFIGEAIDEIERLTEELDEK